MSPNTFTCRHPQTLRISPRAWERDLPHPQASEDVQEAGWAFVEMSLPSQEPPNLNPHMFLLLPIHRWNYRRGVTGGDRCPALRPCLPPTGTPASPPTTWQVGSWASPQTSRDTLSASRSDRRQQPQPSPAAHKRPSSSFEERQAYSWKE